MIEVEKARQHMTEVPMVDLECLDADVQWALQIRLDLPSRSELETRVLRLRGQLAEVVESGVIDKDDPTLGRLFSTAHRLVTHQVPPHQMTHTDAYEHLRHLGNNARAFAAIYRLRRARSNREKGSTS
ncbi:hypothetical protein [Streptomyces sp. NPDC059893]|uniref:hypothetical protein n=1 Tax=Streptomyces sp. NPDC059893 TaxID=3346990 RepID=UPI0036586094